MQRSAAALLVALATMLPPGPAAGAEGGVTAKGQKGGVFPEVSDAPAEEAKKCLDALRSAVENKDEARITAAVEAMIVKRHPDFVPELKKLLADKRDAVGEAAAKALGSQGDKTAATLFIRVVNFDSREKGILQDPGLRAACVEGLGRLGVSGSFDAVHKLARAMVNDPEVRYRYAPKIAKACSRYFGLTKEKRAVSWLIDEVERPELKGGVTNTSPPAEYWKARQEVWTEIRWEVVWALKEITGKEFESANRWKTWMDSEGKKAGMK
jgi:HEAT repeat protein